MSNYYSNDIYIYISQRKLHIRIHILNKRSPSFEFMTIVEIDDGSLDNEVFSLF